MAALMGAVAAASFLSDAYGEEGKEQNSHLMTEYTQTE